MFDLGWLRKFSFLQFREIFAKILISCFAKFSQNLAKFRDTKSKFGRNFRNSAKHEIKIWATFLLFCKKRGFFQFKNVIFFVDIFIKKYAHKSKLSTFRIGGRCVNSDICFLSQTHPPPPYPTLFPPKHTRARARTHTHTHRRLPQDVSKVRKLLVRDSRETSGSSAEALEANVSTLGISTRQLWAGK